ncbi:hypothetical protein H0W26_01190 [Candidatus Dependentiae bacterium]|nr:hypothetical protein [Candidatus Dependentiae bacterium]
MKKRIVTIFIHGTLLPAVFLKIPFLKNFFVCPQGLHPLSELQKSFHLASPFHLASLGTLLCEEDPELFDKDSFFLFGWSGDLSVTKRRKAAAELTASVLDLIEKYASEGISIGLRIIAHSHGGNVALHLAETVTNKEFTIDELILLACPVQKGTASYITNPLFSSIYSVHSHLDVIQRMDPQGIHNFLNSVSTTGLEFTVAHLNLMGPVFSGRHFKPSPRLTQLHVKYPSRELFHIEFILQDYIKSLPGFIRYLHTLPKEGTHQEELVYVIPPRQK